MTLRRSRLSQSLPKQIGSLCPVCYRPIAATLKARGDDVIIEKRCDAHGSFEEVYWSGLDSYHRALSCAYEGPPVSNPQVDIAACPTTCGLCPAHLSPTQIAYVDITNRCDLECPICFASANRSDRQYELPLTKIRRVLDHIAALEVQPTVFFTGGEPTCHPAFLEAVQYGATLGFPYLGAITNGVRLGTEDSFASQCAAAGLQGVILSLDGLEERTYELLRGRPLLLTKLRAVEHCRRATPHPLQVGLASTIANGVNDHEVGALLKFVLDNRDIIRLITYLPITFQGRYRSVTDETRSSERFTLDALTDRLVEQLPFFEKDDVHPASTLAPIAALAERVLKNRASSNLGYAAHNTTHPHCGFRNYLVVRGDEVVPLSRIVDIGALAEDAYHILKRAEVTGHPIPTVAASFPQLLRHLDLAKLLDTVPLTTALRLAAQRAFGSFSDENLDIVRVRGVHFQDAYNFDLDRIQRCTLHYALPDGRLIPSCLYNTVPYYRRAAECAAEL